MQCLNCSNDMTQTGNKPRKYCSDKCRMAHVRSLRKPKVDSKANNGGGVLAEPNKNVDSSESSRRSRISDEVGHAKNLDGSKISIPAVASLEHYDTFPDMYARRENPEKLNWGKPMTFHELQATRFVANRVPVEGDWDYKEAV